MPLQAVRRKQKWSAKPVCIVMGAMSSCLIGAGMLPEFVSPGRPSAPFERRSPGFLADVFGAARRFRILAVIGEFSREHLASQGAAGENEGKEDPRLSHQELSCVAALQGFESEDAPDPGRRTGQAR